VPHSWIIKSLELIGINNKGISFTKKVMPYWRTRMCLHAEHKLIQTEDIKTECGIFPVDHSQTYYRKTKNPPYRGFPQAVSGISVAISDRVIQVRNYEKQCLEVGLINGCRKRDKVGETNEKLIVRCSYLSESAYFGRQNYLAKKKSATDCHKF
jgi:hypothetical protein